MTFTYLDVPKTLTRKQRCAFINASKRSGAFIDYKQVKVVELNKYGKLCEVYKSISVFDYNIAYAFFSNQKDNREYVKRSRKANLSILKQIKKSKQTE